MFTLKTFDLPLCPAPEECYLNVIIDALKQKDRIPFETPDIGLGPSYVRENLQHLTVESVHGGGVFNVIFNKDAIGESEDCMTSSMVQPYATAADALLYDAKAVCVIVSGSDELPFEVVDNKLLMVSTKGNRIKKLSIGANSIAIGA